MKNKFLLTSFLIVLLFIMNGNVLKGNENRRAQRIAQKASGKIQYHDPGLKKVVQIALVVRDVEASAKLWAELLGMPVPEIRTTRPGKEVKEIYRGKPSDGQVKLTFFNLGQVVIELLQPISEGTSWKEFLDKKGEGVQHLGFQVVDPDKTSAELEKAGYTNFHQGRYDGDDGTYIYHDTMDALGVIIELLHSDTKK